MSKRSSRLKQVSVYTEKCFRIFINEKGWKAFISTAIIAAILSWVIGGDTFVVYEKTEKGMFAMVCGCLWIGLFNSIQSICRERDIIKREHRTGMHISSYVTAHMIYELVISLAQALIITAVFVAFRGGQMPESGALFGSSVFEYFIDFALIVYCADVLGIMISCIVHTTNAAMTVMPFVLILQLVLSGMLFRLDRDIEFIENITIGKFGLECLCASADINSIESQTNQMMPFMYIFPQSINGGYLGTPSNLLRIWLVLIGFCFLYGIIGIIALEFIDRDKR